MFRCKNVKISKTINKLTRCCIEYKYLEENLRIHLALYSSVLQKAWTISNEESTWPYFLKFLTDSFTVLHIQTINFKQFKLTKQNRISIDYLWINDRKALRNRTFQTSYNILRLGIIVQIKIRTISTIFY